MNIIKKLTDPLLKRKHAKLETTGYVMLDLYIMNCCICAVLGSIYYTYVQIKGFNKNYVYKQYIFVDYEQHMFADYITKAVYKTLLGLSLGATMGCAVGIASPILFPIIISRKISNKE